MDKQANILKRFVIYMAVLTFVMFTVWAFVKSFKNRPPGDYHTEVCDNRLKDKEYEKALQAANTALEKTENHRGAIMCKALIRVSVNGQREFDRGMGGKVKQFSITFG